MLAASLGTLSAKPRVKLSVTRNDMNAITAFSMIVSSSHSLLGEPQASYKDALSEAP